MDRAALDRPRPHQSHLHGQVVEVPRKRARQHLHLRTALDLEDAGRLRPLDRTPDLVVVERHVEEVDPLTARARDLIDAALHRREHPQPEQVDLQEAGVGTGVLVPLGDLPPLHRRRLHRAELDQRSGGDHHAAGMLGDVAGQTRDLGQQLGERLPARRAGPQPAERLRHPLPGIAARLVDVHGPREPLHLAERQPQRLAEVSDRAARPIGGEGSDQRRALLSIALVHPRDQLLPNVAGEVEVDVGNLGELLVQEAPQEELVLHRVDVGEAGQVADQRADTRSAAPSGRQQPPGRFRTAHLHRNLAGQLQHVLVEEEEAGEPQLPDQRQLLVQPPLGIGVVGGPLIAVDEPYPAELRQPPIRSTILRPRVAVADLTGEVEAQAICEPRRLGHRLRVVTEAPHCPLCREQGGGGVASAQPLGFVEGRPQAHRHHRVLERETGTVVGVGVARRHGGHPEFLRQRGEPAIARPVVAPERPLQLDPEVVRSEGAPQPPREIRGAGRITPLPGPRHGTIAGTSRGNVPMAPLRTQR